MRPASPVLPGVNLPEVIYAKDQPPYAPLPAYRSADGMVLTRWRLSFRERLRVLFSGDLFLWVWTFNQPLQPVSLTVKRPDKEKSA